MAMSNNELVLEQFGVDVETPTITTTETPPTSLPVVVPTVVEQSPPPQQQPKQQVQLVFIPYSEAVSTIASWKLKHWANRITMMKRRFYIHQREKNKKFYWDVRDYDQLRTGCLFGPFDRIEDCYGDMYKYFGYPDKKHVERVE